MFPSLPEIPRFVKNVSKTPAPKAPSHSFEMAALRALTIFQNPPILDLDTQIGRFPLRVIPFIREPISNGTQPAG